MDQAFGIPSHAQPPHSPLRPPVRYLIVIDGDGASLAKLFFESHEKAGEFPAGSEEVVNMTQGLVPAEGATSAEWDAPLASHTDTERLAARVYTLDV